jgi:hypothetical protein
VPICILYLTTRELYGVSFYHAFVDAIQYLIVGNPDMGAASAGAMYNMKVLNETFMGVVGYGWHIASIPIMLGLCMVARRWTLKYQS